MTFQNDDAPGTPAILTPDVQHAVWFLGALVNVRATGDATGGRLDILEHKGERGYGSPLHRHLAEEETFFVLDGEVRVEVGGEAHTAGPGAVAFLPRQLPHAFVVTSPQVGTASRSSVRPRRSDSLGTVIVESFEKLQLLAVLGQESFSRNASSTSSADQV